MKRPLKKFNSIREFLLNQNLLPENDFVIREALTHSSLKYPYNHEKLEFFGDAVLRLAASEFIRQDFKTLNVGQQSALRAQLVSDAWLSEFGEAMMIEDMIIKGQDVMHDYSAISTIRAELMEALIGAVYLHQQSTTNIIQLLSPEWLITSRLFLSDPSEFNSKSILQEWSQSKHLGHPMYKTSEQSQIHGDEKRFKSLATIPEYSQLQGEGWGRSRKEAEQHAARAALQQLKDQD